MPKMQVTMTDDELRAAVCEWAEKHHGMKVDPTKVSVSTKTDFFGDRANKREVHRPVIQFEI